MKDWKIYIPIIAALLSGAGYMGKEAWETSKETQYLKAKVEYQTQHENDLDELIALRMQSCCDSAGR